MSKSVPSTVYTREYYLSDCTGFEEYKRSMGKELDPRLLKLLPYLSFTKGQSLLDIGCGRGEIVFYAASRQVNSVGIDYAKAAIQLAKEARSKQPEEVSQRCRFIQMNAKDLKFESNSFDFVVMTDVVEHLYKDELDLVYKEVFRVLKPGGLLVVHTEPNRIYNDFTYPYYCFPMSTLLLRLHQLFTGKTYPNLPHPKLIRTASHQVMHVNEATFTSLYRQLKKTGFDVKIFTKVTILKPILSWKDKLFNLIVCLDPLSRFIPVSILFANDFVVTARKK